MSNIKPTYWGNIIYESTMGLYSDEAEAKADSWNEEHFFPLYSEAKIELLELEQIRHIEILTEEFSCKIKELEVQIEKAENIVSMVMDNRKMPHKHLDYFERLCCLSERAREYFESKK